MLDVDGPVPVGVAGLAQECEDGGPRVGPVASDAVAVGVRPREVEGLGDGAFHTGAYLFVLDGDRLVYMQVVQDSANGDGVEDADLEAAMRTVLDNLAG